MNAPNAPHTQFEEWEDEDRRSGPRRRVDPIIIPSDEPRRGPLVTFILLGVAMVLVFAGAAWYAYTPGAPMGKVDSAPLIQANPDPVRTKPENPGGLQVPHQDKQIFDKLVGQTEGEKRRVERLLPRPEKPLTAPIAEAEPVAEPTPQATAPEIAKPQQLTQPIAPAEPETKTAAIAPRSASGGVQPTPGGKARVQIAALRSNAEAWAAWGQAQRKYTRELGALTLSIEEVQIKNRGLFFRVQGGPLSQAQARRVCDSLKARGQACIIVQR